MSELQQHNEDVIQFVHAYAEELVKELNYTPEAARLRAELAANVLQDQFGGGGFYVSKGHFFYADERARRIFKRWQAGVSIENLSDEFGMTGRRVYQIIEKIREARFKASQGNLFGEGV